jgi:Protein of unknown function (DUF2970)
MDSEEDLDEATPVTQRRASFLRTMQAVAWAFIGIRKKSDYERDAAQLNPLHVILAGLIGVAMFVGVLIFIVRLVVK